MKKERERLWNITLCLITFCAVIGLGSIFSFLVFFSPLATVFISLFLALSFIGIKGLCVAIMAIRWKNEWSEKNKVLWGLFGFFILTITSLSIFIYTSKKEIMELEIKEAEKQQDNYKLAELI